MCRSQLSFRARALLFPPKWNSPSPLPCHSVSCQTPVLASRSCTCAASSPPPSPQPPALPDYSASISLRWAEAGEFLSVNYEPYCDFCITVCTEGSTFICQAGGCLCSGSVLQALPSLRSLYLPRSNLKAPGTQQDSAVLGKVQTRNQIITFYT